MKTKYRIRCINNKPFHIAQEIQNLTIGKIYETYDNPLLDVCVINDLGIEYNYSMDRFEEVTLEEFREEKLKEIGL